MRTVAVLALATGAAAFSPMMSMETGRRQVVQAGAAAAVAAPLLRGTPAEARMDKSGRAPGKIRAEHALQCARWRAPTCLSILCEGKCSRGALRLCLRLHLPHSCALQ